MPRPTRAESQARNRELLLRTARTLFLRDGYQATSIAKIADAAGFSTGAVYSNFEGKTELALLVLREIQHEQLGTLETVMAGSKPVGQKLDEVREWAVAALASGWPRLELEFALEARADRSLIAAESDRQRTVVDRLAAAISAQLPAKSLSSSLPIRTIAEAAVNLAIGLAVRRVVDPKVTPDSLVDLLRGVLVVPTG
ncbi:MAG TPA: TetR/AcrR family transcriptional regulator [Pseudonocardiaceae bacterium]|nr:TetR/AcrR family transcriptional regulator [Pseudonocardiaceae bacterium]